jgi:hypothetical protein
MYLIVAKLIAVIIVLVKVPVHFLLPVFIGKSLPAYERHADQNGKISDVKLRHIISNDEEADIYREVKLSDFLG